MKKIIIAPDSFKETMSANQVSTTIKHELNKRFPDYDIVSLPIADGGEGSIDAIVASKDGKIIYKDVLGPNFYKVHSFYGLVDNQAIIEVASVVGFNNKIKSSTPANTTTFGIGELILDAINLGVKKIYLCLGGSITNDCGLGIACALGVKFFDCNNQEFIPVGETICKIADFEMMDYKLFNDVEIIGLCDVQNPLYGLNGASYIYAKQKGANEAMIANLDENMKYLGNLYQKKFGIDYAKYSGAGAAGGIGFGILAFLKGKLVKGIEAILDIISFDEIIKDADYIITGEGKLDYQSLNGKVIYGVLNRAKKYDIKVIIVAGKVDGDIDEFKKIGIYDIYETNIDNNPMEIVKKQCVDDLRKAVKLIMLDNQEV